MNSVLIIDDHPVVLQGCRRILEDIGIRTVYEASELVSAYRTYRRHRPDLVVVDLAMDGGLGGLKLIRRLHAVDPQTRILVFSMHRDPIIVTRALEAGALGYALKDTTSDQLTEAIQKVRTGVPYMSHDLAIEIAMLGTRAQANPLHDLTPREMDILARLAEGRSYSEIAERLHVSYKTIVNSAAQLKQKLGVTTLSELVRAAVQHLQGGEGRERRD